MASFWRLWCGAWVVLRSFLFSWNDFLPLWHIFEFCCLCSKNCWHIKSNYLKNWIYHHPSILYPKNRTQSLVFTQDTSFEKILDLVICFPGRTNTSQNRMKSVENFEIFLNGTYRIIFRLINFHLTSDYFTRT